MIKNIKLYLVIAGILFVAGAVVTINIQSKKIKRIEADNFRLESNQYQLMSDARQQTNLYLTEREVTGKLKRERDSLAASLKIKPKFIEKIIYLDNSTHDTIKVPVLTTIVSKGIWTITDSTKCLKLRYIAKLEGDSLNTTRELLEYDNRIRQTFYKQRPHKFLFIKYGRWIYKQQIDATCGNSTIQTFNFTK